MVVQDENGCSTDENRHEVVVYFNLLGVAHRAYMQWKCYCTQDNQMTQVLKPGLKTLQVYPINSPAYRACQTDADCGECAPTCVTHAHAGGVKDCRGGTLCLTGSYDNSTLVYSPALIRGCFGDAITCSAHSTSAPNGNPDFCENSVAPNGTDLSQGQTGQACTVTTVSCSGNEHRGKLSCDGSGGFIMTEFDDFCTDRNCSSSTGTRALQVVHKFAAPSSWQLQPFRVDGECNTVNFVRNGTSGQSNAIQVTCNPSSGPVPAGQTPKLFHGVGSCTTEVVNWQECNCHEY